MEEDYFNVNNSNCCDATITEHSRLCSKCLEHLGAIDPND